MMVSVEQYRALAKRRNKYKAVATVVDGIRFDSLKEAKRYKELRLLERAGKIRKLRCHVPYRLMVKGLEIGKIVIDFAYLERDNKEVFEDTKSLPTITPLFKWKAKHFAAQTGMRIRLV